MQTFCGITTDGMLDYLVAIFSIGQDRKRSSNKVTTTLLAEKMNVSTAAASSMLKRLEESGFVQRSDVEGVLLLKQGYVAAMQLLRRHRLLEVFLMQVMNYTWDQVDAEAHRLEHAISVSFVDRMDELCGYPTHCPHGDPIPNKAGELPQETLHPLTELHVNQSGILWRIATDNASILRHLSQRHLIPGQHITLVDLAPFKGPVTIKLGDLSASFTPIPGTEATQIDTVQIIGNELADLLYVSLDKQREDMRSGWFA